MAKDVVQRMLSNMDFEPPRSSTPSSKARSSGSTLANLGNSTLSSAASSVIPLSGLTPEQIEVIDAIIKRAPENTTTFLAIYKAYEEILEQRGIEATPDVNYYKILLQVGVIKAQYWRDRWRIAKEMLATRSRDERSAITDGPDSHDESLLSGSFISLSDFPPAHIATPRPKSGQNYVHHDPRPITSMSAPHSQHKSSALIHKSVNIARSSTPLTIPKAIPTLGSLKPSVLSAPHLESEISDQSYDGQDISKSESQEDDIRGTPAPPRSFSSRPISMGAVPRQQLSTPYASRTLLDRPTSAKGRLEQQQKTAVDRAERGANGHDFWEVEEMERDADDFRHELLLRRCMRIWRDGIQWISTTLEQVSNARGHILLKSYFHQWVDLRCRRADLEDRVSRINDIRILRIAFRTWQEAREEKKRREVREGVRRRFSVIRDSVNSRIKREALKKWLLAFRYLRMEAVLETNLQRQILSFWLNQLKNVRGLAQVASDFQVESKQFTLARIMDVWKRKVELRHAERIISAFLARRAAGSALETWSRAAKLKRLAEQFEFKHVVAKSMLKWGFKHREIQNLTRKVSIHVRRQDALLQRAVFRVWVAKERGMLLIRIRQTRSVLKAVRSWQDRYRHIKQMNIRASTFVETRSLLMFKDAYHQWRSRVIAFNASLSSAQIHYTHHLMVRMLHEWGAQRRFELRRVKQARIARRWFIKRACWSKWRGVLEHKNRERRLHDWHSNLVKRVFIEWREIVARQQRHYALSAHIEQSMALRIKRHTIHKWMRRVIDFRERAIHVQQIEDVRLRRAALSKWVDVFSQHHDNVALMESFRDVKAEEFLRKVLLHWMQATRKSINRRERLARKQEEMKLSLMSAAWDRWRDRFLERRLRPTEFDVGQQMEATLLFRAFRLWESKTRSIPAIRLCTTRTKRKTLKSWLEALPRARLERKARSRERVTTFRHTFQRWQTAYRTRLALKAVFRARNLALATSDPSSRTSLLNRPLGFRLLPGSAVKPRPFPVTPSPMVPPTIKTSSSSPADIGQTRSLSPSGARKPIPTSSRNALGGKGNSDAGPSTRRDDPKKPRDLNFKITRNEEKDEEVASVDGSSVAPTSFPPIRVPPRRKQRPIPSSAPGSIAGDDEDSRSRPRERGLSVDGTKEVRQTVRSSSTQPPSVVQRTKVKTGMLGLKDIPSRPTSGIFGKRTRLSVERTTE